MSMTRDEAHAVLADHYDPAAFVWERTWLSVMADAVVASGLEDPARVRRALEATEEYLPAPARR